VLLKLNIQYIFLIETNTQISFHENEEKVKKSQSSDLLEIVIPFLIAGFGMVFAGLIFKRVQVGK